MKQVVPRLAANLSWLFTEHAFADRFAAARRHGFEGVECLAPYDLPAQKLARLLNASELKLVMFNLPPGRWDAGERGLAALPGREHEFAVGLEAGRRYAAACGTHMLHAMAGILPAKLDRARAFDCLVKNLRAAAQALASDGCTLLVEPINVRDLPGYALTSLEEAVKLIEFIGEANVRLQADLYHLQIAGGDVYRRVQAVFPLIAHVQIAGVPFRDEPDRGELRYELLFDLLAREQYDGWIGCEYAPHARTEDGLGWVAPWLSQSRDARD